MKIFLGVKVGLGSYGDWNAMWVTPDERKALCMEKSLSLMNELS
ncbi:MAG: hypothetical protein ACK5IJ_12265 [Mangrovibacterium sp.]